MGWLFGGENSDPSTETSSSSSYDSSFGSDSSFSSFDNSSNTSFSDSMPTNLSGLDSGPNPLGSADDVELQKFIAQEQQKAQLSAMIHKMNDICWETCVSSPENKLSSRTETCISNCVDRFVDSSLFITKRFAQLLTKGGGGL